GCDVITRQREKLKSTSPQFHKVMASSPSSPEEEDEDAALVYSLKSCVGQLDSTSCLLSTSGSPIYRTDHNGSAVTVK
ncbi:hypothetical protein JOB18_040582, partial [Solea senegalensis]